MNFKTWGMIGVLSLAYILQNFAHGYDIPCYLDSDPDTDPVGCEDRVVSCGYYDDSNNIPSGVTIAHTIGVNDDTNCGSDRKNNNNIPPIRREWWYVVQWDDRNNNCYEILMQAGECWGNNIQRSASPGVNFNYECQGRCGDGCQSGIAVCSNWARDCLKHDVCRYFHPNNGGASDIDCGDEYNDANDDYTACCATNGCINGWSWDSWCCNRCELYDQNKQNFQDSDTCW